MICWLTDPVYLTDEELVREYRTTARDDERSTALLDELRRRGLDDATDPAASPSGPASLN